ncbi:hypoxanthine phosphoribosyltransferase [Neobacillus bataviensis LMG 21833]|uniref:Hypoxanthine phosphoribosyltransferase n=1 Tax=Neobacillus bataviensis LMG 21833 TaxID=1117379 RepID=K6CU62_9BACI|nr:hypoxanthine phosphoribosyltransferase [Neobacillus bataviensis LMG 21833]
MLASVNVLSDMTPFIVAIVASLFVIDGSLTVGSLIAFFAYVDKMRSPVAALVNAYPAITEGSVALNRLFTFFSTPQTIQEKANPVILKQFTHSIKLNKVSFSYDGKDESIFLIVVLKGSFVFAADLIREIKGDVKVDFISVSSYSDQTETTGKVKLLKDLDTDITNKNVVVVEDIIDSGLTLHFLRDHLNMHKPKQIKICTLLDKPERRRVELPVDYVGFVIPDEFIVGYGIDFAQMYRNLPYIATVEEY